MDNDGFDFYLGLGLFSEFPFDAKNMSCSKVGIENNAMFLRWIIRVNISVWISAKLHIKFQHNMEHCHDWRQLYIYNYTTSWEEGRKYRIFLIYEADVSVQDCQNAL